MFSCQHLPQAQARGKTSNKSEKLETDHHVEDRILTGGAPDSLQCYQEVQTSHMLSVMSQQHKKKKCVLLRGFAPECDSHVLRVQQHHSEE